MDEFGDEFDEFDEYDAEYARELASYQRMRRVDALARADRVMADENASDMAKIVAAQFALSSTLDIMAPAHRLTPAERLDRIAAEIRRRKGGGDE